MKKILIISPHFPPSNLAAVHRSRLFAQHLPSFGWKPIILTVHEKYYEEQLDWNLHKLLPANLQIEKCEAFPVTKPRIIGDIGLRALFHLYKKAKQIIKQEQVDFLYIPIPSFYVALLGRWLNKSTGIQYGIDYIDPWVHVFPGSDKKLSRHWLSTKVAKFLEPIAVKKASVITGVAEGYYQGVIERNPHLKHTCRFGAMPYGGEAKDHEAVKQFGFKPYVFKKERGKIKWVYAGAFLPKSVSVLQKICSSIKNNLNAFEHIEIHFIGTGKNKNGIEEYSIKPIVESYGVYETIIFEHPKRIPYLDVLIHLEEADGVFILGSTEPHYTPSKSYQAVLSKKPIFAILHSQSTAVQVIKETNAGQVLSFDGEAKLSKIEQEFNAMFLMANKQIHEFDFRLVNMASFEAFSAKSVTESLVRLLD